MDIIIEAQGNVNEEVISKMYSWGGSHSVISRHLKLRYAKVKIKTSAYTGIVKRQQNLCKIKVHIIKEYSLKNCSFCLRYILNLGKDLDGICLGSINNAYINIGG